MEVNKRFFEALLQGKDMSLRSLAKLMGMSHSQLSLTFSGDRRMQIDEAAQLATIFGQPLYKVIEAAGVSVRSAQGQRVSVVGVMRGDGTVQLHEEGTIERTAAPLDLQEGCVAIQARTAGSALDWMDSFVFFCPDPAGVDAGALGRFSFAMLKDGTAVMATVKRGYRENTYNLSGTFARESAALEWATPVIITRN